jgi:hypothetical protein
MNIEKREDAAKKYNQRGHSSPEKRSFFWGIAPKT